jgi:hypothetical protein
MAYTNPWPDWASNESPVASAKLDTMSANGDELFAALSGDTATGVPHRHKYGALASRPAAATAGSGCFYHTSDTKEVFWSDGTDWWHCGGQSVYDDVRRANATGGAAVGPSASGHTMTEEAGAWDVVSDLLAPTSGSPAILTYNTKSKLTREFEVEASVLTGSTPASIDIGIVLKYVDASNLLYAQMLPSNIQIHSRIAGTNTNIGNVAVTPFAASTAYFIRAQVFGKSVKMTVNSAVAFIGTVPARHDNVANAAFANAEKVGFRCPNTQDRFADIAVRF